ncbi:hypothetical protein GCM10018773_61270 [Streptomyces candidus]|nr:hypothetical protein GCM10018773_61270 [Streptomyces candidus]
MIELGGARGLGPAAQEVVRLRVVAALQSHRLGRCARRDGDVTAERTADGDAGAMPTAVAEVITDTLAGYAAEG